MSFTYPSLAPNQDLPNTVQEFNSFLQELSEYLEGREIEILMEPMRNPREGQLVLSTFRGWRFAAGAGLYYYENGEWCKVGNGLTRYPVDMVRQNLANTEPLTLIEGTHVTSPATCWAIGGTVARHITLPTMAALSGTIGFLNLSNNPATLNYAGTGVHILSSRESCCFTYSGFSDWSLR